MSNLLEVRDWSRLEPRLKQALDLDADRRAAMLAEIRRTDSTLADSPQALLVDATTDSSEVAPARPSAVRRRAVHELGTALLAPTHASVPTASAGSAGPACRTECCEQAFQ